MSNSPNLSHISIGELDIPPRTSNALESGGIFTILDLLMHTQKELLSIPNFGQKSMQQVREALAAIGIRRVNGQILIERMNVSSSPGRQEDDPSLEEIRHACERIRDGWTEAERKKRAQDGTKKGAGNSWIPPTVQTPNFFDPAQDD